MYRHSPKITVLFSLTFAGVGCSADDKNTTSNTTCNNSTAAGYHSITENGITRDYILQLPTDYDESNSENLPLVISFHGNGGCASSFSTAAYAGDGPSDLSSIANENQFIVAYPQGVARAKGAAEWDPGDNGNSNLNDNDIYFTQQLIADITANHAIDTNRIYATGYSNGGMMAYGLACTLGSDIAAIGIMSGIMLEGSCTANTYTPIIHFHGTADDALPYAGNQEFQSVANVISFWINHNQISTDNLSTTSLNAGQVTHDSYTGGAENSAVSLYTIQDGGHVWFGDSINGQSPNEILWNFLSGFDLNGSL